MPNVFFCVKSAPRATAEERSTSRVDDLFFSASVEAPPTLDNSMVIAHVGRGVFQNS
jgi:hypothetical protein